MQKFSLWSLKASLKVLLQPHIAHVAPVADSCWRPPRVFAAARCPLCPLPWAWDEKKPLKLPLCYPQPCRPQPSESDDDGTTLEFCQTTIPSRPRIKQPVKGNPSLR